MAYQNLSVTLAQADFDAVNAAITTINTKLPFLVMLSPDERRSLYKLGPRSADFVQDASMVVDHFPNTLPPAFDKVEYGKDIRLFQQLTDLKNQVDSLQEKINNTYLAVGSEAMIASLEIYSYVQTASGRTPGLKTIVDKLSDRFKGQGKQKKAINNDQLSINNDQ